MQVILMIICLFNKVFLSSWRSHYRHNWFNVIHIVEVELLKINLLSLFAQIDAEGNAVRCVCRWAGSTWGHVWWLAQAALHVLLLFVLFGKSNLAYLVSHSIEALLFKLAHKVRIPLQLRKEKLSFDSVQLTFHALANKRCNVHLTFGNHNILAANNATCPKTGYLVKSVFFAWSFCAHVFAFTCKLTRRLFLFFKHLTGVKSLQLLVYC